MIRPMLYIDTVTGTIGDANELVFVDRQMPEEVLMGSDSEVIEWAKSGPHFTLNTE